MSPSLASDAHESRRFRAGPVRRSSARADRLPEFDHPTGVAALVGFFERHICLREEGREDLASTGEAETDLDEQLGEGAPAEHEPPSVRVHADSRSAGARRPVRQCVPNGEGGMQRPASRKNVV